MTIKEIAILAGTSRGTVDRVINKRGKVAKDVEARVLEVIKQTNYRPNEVGRSLSLSNKKIVIGVVVASIGNKFFNLIIEGIEAAASKYKNYGISLLIKEVDLFNKKSIIKALDEMGDANIDALAISTLNDPDICSKINSLNVPVVAINLNIDVNKKICFVGCDYENSGKLAANFTNLVTSINEKIGIIVGSLTHGGQSVRTKNYRESIRKDLEVVDLRENFDDDSISYKVTKEMIEDHPDLQLIVFLGAGIDGGLTALKEYDNKYKALTVDQAESVDEGLQSGLVLATITQHPYTQGVRTIDILYDYLIRKRKVEREKILDNSLILKESIIPHKLNEID